MREEAEAQRERDLAAAKAAIDAETRQAIEQIKNQVADLTLLATEKVVGRALDETRGAAPRRRGAGRGRLHRSSARSRTA